MTFTKELVVVAKHARWMLYKLERRRKKYLDRLSHREEFMRVLYRRGADEMGELWEAIRKFEEEPTLSRQRDVQKECADVSNYMAFLSDRAAQEPLL